MTHLILNVKRLFHAFVANISLAQSWEHAKNQNHKMNKENETFLSMFGPIAVRF